MVTQVYAVGTASGSLFASRKEQAKAIEQAMAEAVWECLNEGISLSDEVAVQAKIEAARQRIKAQ